MLNHIATEEELLNICYNTDMEGYITAFDSVLGAPYLDSAVAADSIEGPEHMVMTPTVRRGDPSDYASIYHWEKIIDRQTFGLAEHDIYGSSRVGVKNYWPGQIGLQWNFIDSTVDTVRLWVRKPWYSGEYQDVIKTDSTNLYGNTMTDKFVTQHIAGQKQYELTDHLGDVMATVSDARAEGTTTVGSLISYYTPVVQSAYDCQF
jgi:hypothetical protein